MPLSNAFENLALESSVTGLKGKFTPGLRTTLAGYIDLAGENVIYDPAPGKRVRLYWVGLSASQDNLGENLVIVKFGPGGTPRYRWRMGNPGAFSHWEILDGDVDESLILELSTADLIDWNITITEE